MGFLRLHLHLGLAAAAALALPRAGRADPPAVVDGITGHTGYFEGDPRLRERIDLAINHLLDDLRRERSRFLVRIDTAVGDPAELEPATRLALRRASLGGYQAFQRMVASPPPGFASHFEAGEMGLQMSGGDLNEARESLRPFFQGLDDRHLADMAAALLSNAPFSIDWRDVSARLAGDLSPIATGGAIAILAASDQIRLHLAGRLVDPGREPGFYLDAAVSADRIGISGNPFGATSVESGYQLGPGRTVGATVGAADLRLDSSPRLETGVAGTWDGYRYRLVYFNDPAPDVGSSSQGGSGSLAWGTTALRATFAGVEGPSGTGLQSGVALSESWRFRGGSALAGTLGLQTHPFPASPGAAGAVTVGGSYRTAFTSDWSLTAGASVGQGFCAVCLPSLNGFATVESLRRDVFGTLSANVDPTTGTSAFGFQLGGTFGGTPDDSLLTRATTLVGRVEDRTRDAERLEQDLETLRAGSAPDRDGRISLLLIELSNARADIRTDLRQLSRVRSDLAARGVTGAPALSPEALEKARRQAARAPG